MLHLLARLLGAPAPPAGGYGYAVAACAPRSPLPWWSWSTATWEPAPLVPARHLYAVPPPGPDGIDPIDAHLSGMAGVVLELRAVTPDDPAGAIVAVDVP